MAFTALTQAVHFTASHGSGILDRILHSFIWAAMGQIARFLFHDVPALGRVGLAVVLAAAGVWFYRGGTSRR